MSCNIWIKKIGIDGSYKIFYYVGIKMSDSFYLFKEIWIGDSFYSIFKMLIELNIKYWFWRYFIVKKFSSEGGGG